MFWSDVCCLLIKVIAAEGEQKASRALREASEIIGDSPAALQLRYLQVHAPLKLYYYNIARVSLYRSDKSASVSSCTVHSLIELMRHFMAPGRNF
jgi:hypothetical protein